MGIKKFSESGSLVAKNGAAQKIDKFYKKTNNGDTIKATNSAKSVFQEILLFFNGRIIQNE